MNEIEDKVLQSEEFGIVWDFGAVEAVGSRYEGERRLDNLFSSWKGKLVKRTVTYGEWEIVE